jgi:hypothetical protein
MIQHQWAWLCGWWIAMGVACGGSAFSADSNQTNVTGDPAGAATNGAGNAGSDNGGGTGGNTGAGGMTNASGGASGFLSGGLGGTSSAGSSTAGAAGRGGGSPSDGGGSAGSSVSDAGLREAGVRDGSSNDAMPDPCPGLLLTVNKDLAEAQTCNPSVVGDNCVTLVEGVCCHVPVASKDSAATAAYLAALATYKSNCSMACTITCVGGNASCKLVLGGQGYSCQR